MLGSILGSPYFGKLPHGRLGKRQDNRLRNRILRLDLWAYSKPGTMAPSIGPES